MSQAELSDRLDQRFRLLTSGSRTALERQQTLRAAVGWSYSLLTGAEQTLLARLSVFADGFGLDAAEAVAGPAASTYWRSRAFSGRWSKRAWSWPSPPV